MKLNQVKSASKKKGGAWGNDLQPTYKVASFIHKYRIYRMFSILPAHVCYTLGKLFGFAFLARSKTFQKRIKYAFHLYIPNATPRRLNQLYHALITHMGQLLFSIMFRDPNAHQGNMHKFVTLKHKERLDEALKQGKGVIMPSIHIGNFIVLLGGLLLSGYDLAVVGNLANITLFQNLMPRKDLGRLYVIGTTKFDEIRKQMEEHLRKNHLLFLMHDFANNRQLATPYYPGKYDFLIHAPQSWLALHDKVGSPIVPVVSWPMGEMDKTCIEFLDATPLYQKKATLNPAQEKQYHGEMNIALHRIFAPFLLAYLHCWEELATVPSGRIGDSMNLPKNTTLANFLHEIEQKAIHIINISYEPGRDDQKILDLISSHFKRLKNELQHPDQIVRKKRLKIDLTAMSGKARLDKLIIITVQIVNEIEGPVLATSLRDLHRKIMGCFHIITNT